VVGRLDGHGLAVHADHRALEERRDAEPPQRALRLVRERGREGREDAVDRLDEQDAALAGIDRAEVAPQRVARELGDLARHLDAGGAGADDDERQPRALALRVVLQLRRLERAEDARAAGERALQRLDLGATRAQSSWPK
jgi:hypothetical protein